MSSQTRKEEFDRTKCFTFFESYRDQAAIIAEDFGKEIGFDFFMDLTAYALYQTEPSKKTRAFITGLKNTIDAGQEKRERGFNSKHGENMEQTEAILNYIKENPTASERQIAEAVTAYTGVSVSNAKVHKVKVKYKDKIEQFTSKKDVDTEEDNTSNSNSNTNINSNLNLNNNSVSVSVSNANTEAAAAAQEDADASKEEKKKEDSKKEKKLEDLSTEDLQYIIEALDKRTEQYRDIQRKFNLKFGSVNKDTVKSCREIINQRAYEADLQQSSSSNTVHFSQKELEAMGNYASTRREEEEKAKDIGIYDITDEIFAEPL